MSVMSRAEARINTNGFDKFEIRNRQLSIAQSLYARQKPARQQLHFFLK